MNSRPLLLSRPNRLTPALTRRLLLAMAGLSASAYGAEILKSNNADSLASSSSWVGGLVPGAQDIAVFDSTLAASTAVGLDASLAFGGLKVIGNQNGILVDSFGSGLGSAAILTLGQAGLNFSQATAGTTFEFDSPTFALPAGLTQPWSVADNATVRIRGPLSRGTGATIDYGLGVAGTGKFIVDDASFGTSSVINGNATVNGADFADISTTSGLRTIVPGASLGLYQTNPAPDATTVNPTPVNPTSAIMDFTATMTSDGSLPLQGITTTSAGWFHQGFRFNVPNARTDLNQWTVSTGAGKTMTVSVGVIVGPGVGTDNVVIVGTGFFRIDNSTNQIHLAQNNPQGDLIFDNTGGINARNSASAKIIKSGVGRVILNTSTDANNGLYINAGTFQFGSGGTVGRPGTGPIVNNGVLVFDRSDALVVGGIVSGTGTLTKNGTGALTFSGANTYTGATTVNGGSIVLSSSATLGATSAITLGGGGLTYGTGVTTDFSTVPVTLSAGINTLNTNGNNITFANAIGAGGPGALAKAGTGTLTLAGANTYTGGTTVQAGVLAVNNSSGSGTGTGTVSVASGATLTGAGSISGGVTLNGGATLASGSAGVGTLSVGALNLAANSIADFEFASTSSYDRVITTGANALTINGGALHLYAPGGTTPFFTPGTYNLIQFSGAIQGAGPGALSVLNPQAGYAYTFGASGNFVTLLVELNAILSQWTSTGAGSWGSGSNWSNGVPTSGYTAQLTTSLAAPATITLDGNRTINGLVLASAQGYTLAQGSAGTLTFDKGVKNAAVNVTLGSHTISAPVALASTIAVSTDAGTSLAFSGSVSGLGGVIKTGPGALDFTGANSLSGAITVTGGVLGFAQSSSLGSGSLALNGGTLRYDVGNTADISAKSITFGQDGATIDTGANDVIWLHSVGNGGSGSLTKTGSGILALAAANTYTGNTILQGGTVQIDGNDRLGVPASSLVFDGGTLSASGTLSLSTTTDVTVQRALVVNATGGTLSVPAAATLSVDGPLSGPGVLAKTGPGTLSIAATGNALTKTGGFTLREGTLRFNVTAGINTSSIIGDGTLTLEGGTLTTATAADVTLGVGNPIAIPEGKTASFITPNRFSLGGAVSGAGTLNLSIATTLTRADLSNDWTAFTGSLNLTGTGGVRLLNNGGNFNTGGLVNTALNAGTGLTLIAATNSGGNVFPIGALSGGATLTNSNGGAATYQIGARNESTVFSGSIVSGITHNHLTKVGTGTLTLNGATLQNGLTTISAGTLLIDSVLPASVATAALPNRLVTVAAVGTLGGNGTITPDTVVNGTLQPDGTGSKGGHLVFGGLLELTSTSTTRIDFDAARFTGIKSVAPGSVIIAPATTEPLTPGAALKFQFHGTVFNGSYLIFDLAAPATGAFAGVSVTTSTMTETALADNGSGVWSATIGAETYSFNGVSGVLTITGGATAVTPGGTTLTATPGNTQVTLGWTSASGADTYTLKRSSTPGGPYAVVQANLGSLGYTDTGLLNDTTYYYVVQAYNSASHLSGPVSAEVAATPGSAPTHTALQTWRFEQFGIYDDTAGVLAGDTEDFDGDGLANLMEYAIGTVPTVANASPVTVARSGNFLTLSYPRRAPADPALVYTVQGASDLTGGFVPATGATVTAGSVSTYTDDVNVSAPGARRFLRLSVSHAAP